MTPTRGSVAPARAARDVDAARRRLSEARRRFADVTAPGHADVVLAPEWRRIQQVLEMRRERLLALPGVVGVGLGFRRRKRRVDESERCIVVLVSRKRDADALVRRGRARVPRWFRAPDGTRVATDVVEFGALRRHVDAGAGVGPARGREMGTIGAFAVEGDTGRTVALTAMHVTGERECPPESCLPMVSPSALESGSRPLGALVSGTMRGVDAAKIAIDPPLSASMDIVGIGRIEGWRPLTDPGDRGTAVQMFGAATGRTVVGRIVEPSMSLPFYDLDSAILVDIPSTDGDSGAAIVDNDRLVLGLLVGESSRFDGLRVFTPISSVLARLSCDIPSNQ